MIVPVNSTLELRSPSATLEKWEVSAIFQNRCVNSELIIQSPGGEFLWR